MTVREGELAFMSISSIPASCVHFWLCNAVVMDPLKQFENANVSSVLGQHTHKSRRCNSISPPF